MSTKPRLLSFSNLVAAPEARALLETHFDVVFGNDRETLLAEIPTADAYFSGLAVRLDAEAIAAAEKLQVVVTPSTGTDHLDLAALEARQIPVLSLKKDIDFLDSITATAEMAWALLLASIRKLPWSFASAQDGVWARDRYRGHQLSGKTFGIVGYGRLGKMVADYAHAFRMRVIACDPVPFEAPHVERVDFDTLLAETDVISLHVHLTEETKHLISADAFAKMKDGVVLLNTSRGLLIDEAAFLANLESGKIGAAGVDVIHGEWRDDLCDHPLIQYASSHENLVISPHTGGITFESQAMSHEFTAQKLVRFFAERD